MCVLMMVCYYFLEVMWILSHNYLKLLACLVLLLALKQIKLRAQFIWEVYPWVVKILLSLSLTSSKASFLLGTLGVPLSSKKLYVIQCQPLVKKIICIIENWFFNLLSYAGRLQLIKPVLFGVQTYWSQVFVLPHKVMKLIQTTCRVFL